MGGCCCGLRYRPVDLHGKTVVVTGSNTGIGKETVRALAEMGAEHVIMACRNREKTEPVVRELQEETSNLGIEFMPLDLSSLRSVGEFAARFKAKYQLCNILINNAGLAIQPLRKTEDGFESQFQVNYLGPMLLTLLLRDTFPPGARVVNVSSYGHHFGVIDFANLQGEVSYKPFQFYANSKLCQMLFNHELARRLAASQVNTFALHPGTVRSDISRDFPLGWKCYSVVFGCCSRSTQQGAVTSIVAATSTDLTIEQSGGYLEDAHLAKPNKIALDNELAERLWEHSVGLLAVKGFRVQ